MFSLAVVVIALLATLAAAALIATTEALRTTTSDVASAVESVRLVEEAEISLLLHTRADDAMVQGDIETELRAAVAAADHHVTAPGERRVLRDVVTAVETYLQTARTPGATPAEVARTGAHAFAALEQLVDLNVEHARRAHAEALHWNTVANGIGIGVAATIILITIVLSLWLRRRFVRPWFDLAGTMRRFAHGERSARATERGPDEVLDMSRSFNQMADAIATQRQAQVAFLGGVAHDLRTPVSALRLAVDLLPAEAPLPPEPQVRRMIDVIGRQLDQLERMLGDFVDMSQIEAGRLELRTAHHDLRGVVRDAVRLFASADPSRELRLVLPEEPATVLCDEVRINQAVTNLVSNAVKYAPADQPIEVAVKKLGDRVAIEVVDHGPGIAREDQRQIFDPFRRVGDRRAARGTGLGLFNVKQIVEAHGGEIEVESVPGHGATFRILLGVDPRDGSRNPKGHARML